MVKHMHERNLSRGASKPGLIAQDVMTHEPVCVNRSMSLRQLASVFEEHEISGAPVVDRMGKLIGIVSKTDLIRRVSEGTHESPPAYLFEILVQQGAEDAAEESEVISELLICVEDFMTQGCVTVKPTTPIAEIAKLMFDRNIHRVVVVDDEQYPVGIITSLDMLGVFPQ